MAIDKGTDVVKIRRSVLEMVIIAVLGAGGGGGVVKLLVPQDSVVSAKDCEQLQKTIDRIETSGTAQSRINDKRITTLEARWEYTEKILTEIKDGQATMMKMLRSSRTVE